MITAKDCIFGRSTASLISRGLHPQGQAGSQLGFRRPNAQTKRRFINSAESDNNVQGFDSEAQPPIEAAATMTADDARQPSTSRAPTSLVTLQEVQSIARDRYPATSCSVSWPQGKRFIHPAKFNISTLSTLPALPTLPTHKCSCS
jgi:hypothetical protein